MAKKPPKFLWRANASSGGTLNLLIDLKGQFTKKDKELALAQAIKQCQKFMEKKGYIPHDAKLLSSRDIARHYGKTRQYWEKLLNEGKILYKETSAGRITTNLWIQGYLGDKDRVDGYVKNVRAVLVRIKESDQNWGSVVCPVCTKDRFEFYVNKPGSTNGVCRSCGFHVHTTT